LRTGGQVSTCHLASKVARPWILSDRRGDQ
jgi:hypothetical protein